MPPSLSDLYKTPHGEPYHDPNFGMLFFYDAHVRSPYTEKLLLEVVKETEVATHDGVFLVNISTPCYSLCWYLSAARPYTPFCQSGHVMLSSGFISRSFSLI